MMEVDQFVPADLEGMAPPVGPDGMGHGGGSMKREYDAGPGADDDIMFGGGMGPGKDVYRQRIRQKARMGPPSGGGDG